MSPKFRWNKYDHSSPYEWLELKTLKRHSDRGEINPKKVITLRELYAVGCIPEVKNGLALVNNHELKHLGHKIHLEVTFVTPSAKQAIENSGGIVRLKFVPKRLMDRLLRPWKYEIKIDNLDELPRPRWRHMFPDYPQLAVVEDLKHLGKFQVHPQLLPQNVGAKEKKEQENKLALNDFRPPKPRQIVFTGIKDKLFRWSKHT